ncbi:MAG TPA: T9SS type A sorting domain-containing protein [Flavobacterium sp.]|jgi:hypothetical protein|nr:T9SS type A sorting domain-containing protein [Flavobacterium sp.]
MKAKITQLFIVLFSTAAVAQITDITATIPYQGVEDTASHLGQGQYEIFYDTGNGILDKPIILSDGFDPTDTRDIASIYTLLDYGTGQNLADDLRAQGYDIVILNFPNYTRPSDSQLIAGGSDYIQRNAMVFVELVNQINAIKVGAEKNVVIGPSVGGLITRYGLRYMEMNSLDHDTRLYISFDAPHKGANIPIGFQHLFNYMANGPLEDATIAVLVDTMLKSNASRQMLIDQFEGHLIPGDPVEFNTSTPLPTGKPGFRNAFQSELDAMGLPSNARNVAISNGAGNGMMNGTPDMVVIDHTFNLSSTQRAIINLRFTPTANNTNQVSRFRAQASIFGFWVTAYESMAESMAPSYTDGLDSAPGGRFDITSMSGLAGDNPMLTEFFDNLNISYFDFVPTPSSLAITGTQNWYEPVTALSTTAFDATFVPTVNENHVTLSTENLAFILNEILNPVMATTDFTLSGLQIQNPVNNNISIYSSRAISNANIQLTDISGKIILSRENQRIEGNYQIPVALARGMYLLTLKSGESSITKKLIRN